MDTKTKASIGAILAQRNQGLDMLADYAGELAVRDETIKGLQERIAQLEKPPEKPEAEKPTETVDK